MKRDIRSMKNADQPSAVTHEDAVIKARNDFEKYAGKSRAELIQDFAALSGGMDAAQRESLLSRVAPLLTEEQRAKAEAIIKNLG